MRGDLVWDICALVPSEAGLTRGGLSQGRSLKRGTATVRSICTVEYKHTCTISRPPHT